MGKTLILSLILLCKVCGPSEREMQFAEELQHAGIKVDAGPWDINNKTSLMDLKTGMCGWHALWGRYDTDNRRCLPGLDEEGNSIWLYTEDVNSIWKCDKDGRIVWCWHEDKDAFTFNTVTEVRDLAQKLRNGKAPSKAYLLFHKNLEQFYTTGNKIPSILYLDPRGFFFSAYQTQEFFCPANQTAQSLPSSYWTMNKDFYEAASSLKMPEFERQLEESDRRKQEKQEQTKMLESIRKEAQDIRKELELRFQEGQKTQAELFERLSASINSAQQYSVRQVLESAFVTFTLYMLFRTSIHRFFRAPCSRGNFLSTRDLL